MEAFSGKFGGEMVSMLMKMGDINLFERISTEGEAYSVGSEYMASPLPRQAASGHK